MKRRKFIQNSVLSASLLLAPNLLFAKNKKEKNPIIGHGDFRYRLQKDWIDPKAFKVKDCHEMVCDKNGRLILLTNETKNNVIIIDRSGKVLKTWGDQFPGGHGLTLHDEGGEEFLYITDTNLHQVYKTTLDGRVLMTIDFPKESGLYASADKFKPTETAVGPNGDIYIADGYGQSLITHLSNKGEFIGCFGGFDEKAVDDKLNCSHGICLDTRDTNNPTLLVTSRSTQQLKRYTLEGKHIETFDFPGCWICRPVIRGENIYFAVIRTNTWFGYDGFTIVLDKNNKIISAPGGSEPTYKNNALQKIKYEDYFLNPHDVCIDHDENMIVPQWYSGKTMPYFLERV
ncbi:MAG: 6-bladed beta-propeller [Reichenbachiella sp.]